MPTVDMKQVRILLPLWASAGSFRLLLSWVNTNGVEPRSIPKDLKLIQNLLWLTDFFQIYQLQQQIIFDTIIPNLSPNNVLMFLEDSFSKVSVCQELKESHDKHHDNTAEDTWYELFNSCVHVAAIELMTLIKAKEKELLKLPESVIDEIIERSFKFQNEQMNQDPTEVLSFIEKVKKSKDIFSLISSEKKTIIQAYEKLVKRYAS